ncbi:uncharacterized protein PAC_12914 [Phialocephala subalpina]|uniref:DUF7918 domain-containing protein n=1 Tax=Phialocephala subalpina TaxID=576137 RepID=A0A1L7XDH6_9HELO|nr:uncharacterized protein PAC_12914 [Phialocephala subalpina]
MAVHPDLPGVEIVVCVDGVALEEFEDTEGDESISRQREEDDTTLTVSKYIKSVADQEFGIKYTLQDPFKMDCPILGVTVFLDGKKIIQMLAMKTDYQRMGRKSRLVDRLEDVNEDGEIMFRTIRFSKVETTLDDHAYSRVEKDQERMRNVGCIDVEIWRKEGQRRSSRVPDKIKEDLQTGAVHEKALKGEPKYHGISLGDARPLQTPTEKWKAQELDKYPIACFTFKYRSELALKELLIIERTPEPEESTPEAAEPIDLDQLDAEQKRKVEEFARSLLSGSSQATRIKRERDEGPFGSSKKPRPGEKITIDLTDD